jgi:hypothetical protein
MKRVGEIWIMGTMLLLAAESVKGQEMATATVSANIMYPVSVSFEEPDTYTQVVAYNRQQSKSSLYQVTVADFSVASPSADLYNISIPPTLNFKNENDGCCITAIINQEALEMPQLLTNGQKQFTINSELEKVNGYIKGQHKAAPFEVTVNFN